MRFVPRRLRDGLYHFALARGSLDVWLDRWFVSPFVWAFRTLDRLDRRWAVLLAGKATSEASSERDVISIEETR
jgi:hypothetical protein